MLSNVKSFLVQSDDHLLGLLRYVERNPVSAGLVERALTRQGLGAGGRVCPKAFGRCALRMAGSLG